MPFDWHSYLSLAERLLGDPSEAAQRSAVSRAYYAALSCSREWLIERGVATTISTDASHQAIWDAFRGGRSGPARRIHQKGTRLRRQRRSADYDNEFEGNVAENARLAARLARELLQDLGRLRPTDM